MTPDTSPEAIIDYRRKLSRGEDIIDPETWAGSLPAASGIAARVRIGRSTWFNLLWLLPMNGEPLSYGHGAPLRSAAGLQAAGQGWDGAGGAPSTSNTSWSV